MNMTISMIILVLYRSGLKIYRYIVNLYFVFNIFVLQWTLFIQMYVKSDDLEYNVGWFLQSLKT